MMNIKKVIFLFALGCMVGSVAHSQVPTKLVVRAKAKDAKFIGSSIGGAMVVVRDPITQEILASGVTSGGTGNTGLLMGPHERGQQLSDEKTAGFEAIINLERPRFVQVDVFSPYAKRQATQLSSAQLWLIPGKDIDGDGLIIEVPGFIIDILTPTTHQSIVLEKAKGKKTEIKANMVMMCGCTIESGGLWNGDLMEVDAVIYKDGKEVAKVRMKNAESNIFLGSYEFTEKGSYEIAVTGFDPATNNTGVDKVPLIVN